jgi:hypothetical protein
MARTPISEVFTAGTLFDYNAWDNDSVITLTNVPWTAEYDDVLRPDQAREKANAWINSHASTNVTLENMSYAVFDRPIQIATPFNIANQYNYVRVSNPIANADNPDIQKDYFYFITSVGSVNPGTTVLTVVLDVWTTFAGSFKILSAYLERGHMGIANVNAFAGQGREWLTVPEGLNYGSEYQIKTHETLKIMRNDIGADPLFGGVAGEAGYNILVCTTVDISRDPGSMETEPKVYTSQGGAIQGIATGAAFYVFDGLIPYMKFMQENSDKPWFTQGIQSIQAIPAVKRYLPQFRFDSPTDDNPDGMTQAPAFPYPTLVHEMAPNWRTALKEMLPEKYRMLTKFLTSPYTWIEMTTYGATPVMLKPELWQDSNATVHEMASIVPSSQRVVFTPRRYNALSNSEIDQRVAAHGDIPVSGVFPYPQNLGPGDDGGEYLDVFTMITNFPSMPIVSNNAIAYLANNKNSLAYQHSSADYSQDRTQVGTQNMQNNAMIDRMATAAGGDVSRNLNNDMTNESIRRANEGMVVGAVSSIATATAGGAIAGPGGALIGAGMATGGAITQALSTNINNNSALRSTEMGNAASLGQQEIGLGASQKVTQNNANMANRLAQSDKVNAIAGINAKVQDAKLSQPSMIGQMGGESFNLVMDNVGLSLRFKMIDPAAIRSIGDFWLRYGYAVQAFTKVPESMLVMSQFSFWKMQDVKMETARFPEFYRQVIRGILMKGVTVYNNPADIGDSDIDSNTPLPNVRIGY